MRYQTPQFIEEETKLFGPLTFRQFVYLVGGGGIAFVVWKLFPIFVAILIGVPVIMLSLALAFYRVNERPFIDVLESAFYFIFSHKLYTYQKSDKPTKEMFSNDKTKITTPTVNLSVSGSKLKDLAWSLDINEKTNSRSGDNNKTKI
ncbi:MAG: PrgI family protein [bacterium]